MKKLTGYWLIPTFVAFAISASSAKSEQVAPLVIHDVQTKKDFEELAPSRFGGHVHALAVNPQIKDIFPDARPIYLGTGLYRSNVKFATDDPQNPIVEVGVHATVQGGSLTR